MKNIVWMLLILSLGVAVACSKTETTTEPTPNPDTRGLSEPKTPPATDADNTARNAENSTVGDTATAGQGESKADVETTAAIRKAIVDDKSLSVNAHNVKVMTTNGVVTLRGPVKSEDEKRSVEAKAKQVAGVTQVNNLLEVEKNP
jgi:hyperosmotically inducible periplasmic protein